MSQPVWTLSVDLQTKTAVFQSGLADAAKSARGSFNDIKQGAGDMARETSVNMGEARHGVMMLGEEFGVHLPRGLTSFLASLGPVGATMEAAFPFLAIALGATLLIEHLVKMREEAAKAAEAQVQFGTTSEKALMGLDDKLIRAGMETDELAHNHLAGLKAELELIDHASLTELMSTFDIFAKGADAALAELKTSWYQFGAGSAGAKHSLEQFKLEYDSLLSHQKDSEALDLLNGKIEREEKILNLQKQARDAQGNTTQGKTGHTQQYEAQLALQKLGVGFDEKEIESQQILVNALDSQLLASQKIAALKKAQQGNAETKTDNKVNSESDAQDKRDAESAKWLAEQEQNIADKSYKDAIARLQENEKQKIEATNTGSSARLAAIGAAIQEENARGLQETGFYRSLLADRNNLTRQMGVEADRIKQEAGKEAADHDTKMAEIKLAAQKETNQLLLVQGKISAAELLQADKAGEIELYQNKRDALNLELAALSQNANDYQNRKQALNNKIEELQQQHNNKMQQLDDQAAQKQLATLRGWENRLQHDYASGFTQVIMGKQSFAQMMAQMDSQIAASALKFTLMSVEQLATAQGRKRFGDARTAAADAFASAGNPILGAVEAVGAFSAVMAFEKGGMVPGVGKGDTVPAMLEPGEGVLTGKQMEYLSKAGKSGNSGSGGDTHIHMHIQHHVNALDSDGFAEVLDKHADTLSRHLHNQLRKMNR